MAVTVMVSGTAIKNQNIFHLKPQSLNQLLRPRYGWRDYKGSWRTLRPQRTGHRLFHCSPLLHEMDHSSPCRMDGTHSRQAFGGFTPIPRGLDFSPNGPEGMPWADAFGMVRSGAFSGPCLPRPLGEPSGCVKTKSMRMNQRQYCQNDEMPHQQFYPLPLEFMIHFKTHSPPRGLFWLSP